MTNSNQTPPHRRSKTPWVVGWILLTLFTLPLALGALAFAADTCDPQSDFQILCTPPETAATAQTIAGLLIVVWLGGSVAILLGAQSRAGRQPEDVRQCPRCGREVTAGSPSCLGCGYNLVAGR